MANQANIVQIYRDGKRVLECLQRALRVADACMDSSVSVELFVEILNQYVYYYEQQNEVVSQRSASSAVCRLLTIEQVTIKYINGLIELIQSNLQTNQESTSLEAPKRHFERTLEYIKAREWEGIVIDPK